MDDFNPRKNKRHASVDGFIPAAGHHGRKGFGDQGRSFGKKYRKIEKHGSPTSMAPRVDQFGSIDGFTPAVQPRISRPGEKTKPTEVIHSFDKNNDGYKSARLAHQELNEEFSKENHRKRWFNFRKRKQGKMNKTPRFNKRTKIAMISAAFLILIGGGLALRAFLLSRNIFKGGGNSVVLNNQNVDPTLLRGEGDGRVNILILGKGGTEQRDGPELTDTIILASIDPLAKEATLLSIPRDLWVTAPSGYSSKINEVYANAKYSKLDEYSYQNRNSNQAKEESHSSGIDAIKQTVEDNMGVPVHYYTMMDFAGFKKAIDTVGGIDIDVKERLVDYTMAWENGGNPVLAEVGWQKFDGKRALMYARSRKGTNGTDFGRAERQRQVILALKDKVLSTGTLANPLTINGLISDFGGQVSTDFSVNEILRVYDLAKEISGDKVGSVGLDDYVTGQAINGLSAQVPKAGVGDFSEIQNYVRNIMRDAFLKQEDAKVMILNGTGTPGLATKTSNELKSFGYNVYKIDDAPTSDYTSTILVDLRDGKNKYTQNYLEKRLNVKAVTKLPDDNISAGEADFVIIIGSQ